MLLLLSVADTNVDLSTWDRWYRSRSGTFCCCCKPTATDAQANAEEKMHDQLHNVRISRRSLDWRLMRWASGRRFMMPICCAPAAWTAGGGVTGALTARTAPTKWDAVSRASVPGSDWKDQYPTFDRNKAEPDPALQKNWIFVQHWSKICKDFLLIQCQKKNDTP